MSSISIGSLVKICVHSRYFRMDDPTNPIDEYGIVDCISSNHIGVCWANGTHNVYKPYDLDVHDNDRIRDTLRMVYGV